MSDNFTEDQRICDAATEGPWRINKEGLTVESRAQRTAIAKFTDYSGVLRGRASQHFCNAEFIAEARTGWPAALERIRAQDAEIERLRADNDSMMRSGTCGACQDVIFRNDALRSENERLRAALERMDDRKNPMMPRSQMARIAIEALDAEVSV